MSKFTTQRNFGFGKQMDWAGHQALKDIYGRGHFGTVASHAQRWRQFCHWARSIHGINDACAIDQSLLERYAADLAERVEDETLAVSYAQNLIVSANITLEALRQDKTIRIESPASYVGKRQTVRTRVPDGMDWSEIDRLVACLRAKNLHRAAAIVLLCRSFGIRLREAVLANLCGLATSGQENAGRLIFGKVPRAAGARKSNAGCRSANVAGLPFEKLSRSEISWAGRTCSSLTRRLTIWSMMAKSIGHENPARIRHQGLSRTQGCLGLREIRGNFRNAAAPVLQAGTSPGQQNDDPVPAEPGARTRS
jgi:hypothetical protein